MMAAVEDHTAPAPRRAAAGGAEPGRGWAVPGSAEEQPAPGPFPADAGGPPAGAGAPSDGTPGAPGGPGGGPVDGAAAGVPRVALRPMTTADILDGGFAVLKARPRRILAIAAAFVVPTHLLAAYLQRDAMGAYGIGDLFTDDPTIFNEPAGSDPGTDVLVGLMYTVIPAVALVCVAAALGHLVTQWAMGRDAPAGEMLRVVARRWWPLLGSFVLVKLAEGLGLLGCYVGVFFVMALFVPVAPIVGVEGCGPFEALRRSVRLTRARYFPTLGIALLMGIVATLLSTALAALPQGLAGWIGYRDGWPLLALGSILAEVIVLPFVAAATVLLYLDLRVRLEGLDIEMAATSVLDRGR